MVNLNIFTHFTSIQLQILLSISIASNCYVLFSKNKKYHYDFLFNAKICLTIMKIFKIMKFLNI
nr:hypothetical protein [Clostridia bacterium]